MRLLHLADLHLGWQPEFLAHRKDERAMERDQLLERAADFALDKKNCIDGVLIAGDLFETHRPPRALFEKAVGQLERLARAGCFLLTVPGNHDEITYHDSIYRTERERWPGILVRNPEPEEVARLDFGGKSIAFVSLAFTGGLTRTPLTEFPRTDADLRIGVVHGSLNWDAGDRSLPVAKEGLSRSGYDCLALGHLHSHLVQRFGKTTAVYAGAVEAKNFSDPGCGFFTVLDVQDKLTVERHTAGSRPCLTREIDLNLCENTGELTKAVENLGDERAMMRVVLRGGVNFQIDTAALHAKCSRHFYHLQIEDEGLFLDEENMGPLANEPNIRGYFVRNLLARLAEAGSEDEKETIRRALMRGIAALGGGEK